MDEIFVFTMRNAHKNNLDNPLYLECYKMIFEKAQKIIVRAKAVTEDQKVSFEYQEVLE